ncbi:hypothetical protein V7128_01405 [Neobacillus vireti]|uniref:hypothetical protein n=1 Tax=Neobacillus vireti TaxID=220686 RepID=UPI002FFF669F
MSKGESVLNKYRIENGVLYDQFTGEVIDRKEIKKAYQAELANFMLESELDLNEIGERLDLRVVSDKRGKTHHVINVKEGFHFVKVFKVALREVLSTNSLSKAAKSAYLDFQAYTSFPNNTVIVDGETPDTEKLCDLLDLKKTRLYDVLKELETADLILRKKINGQLVIYINPFIYNCGLVDQSTLELFESSQYNPTINN